MTRRMRAALACLAAGTVLAACSNSTSSASAGGNGAPGVTAGQITVGSIANVTGPLSSDFAPITDGVQAYFDMVNAQGGVDGRKLNLAFKRDDQGNSTTDLTVAQQLVQQDHVFAIVGVGTPFFGGASYLAHQGVPTFGYQVSSDWSDGPSLFGTYGSYLDFSTGAMSDSYVAKQLHATSVGVIAYGVPQSANACQAAITGFGSFGVNVGYQDLAFGFGSDPTADVLQMKAHHVDEVLTCLDVSGNVAFARAIAQNGLAAHQVWLNGYDRSTLQQYASLMNGVTIQVQHVPFEASTSFPGRYPGMDQYLATMQKYAPGSAYDEVAFEGYVEAAQFVAGLQLVGKNLTQAKLVAAINKTTDFTGGGVMPPVNWTQSHTKAVGPFCSATVVVQNGKFVPEFVQANDQVFVCFDRGSDTPVAPLPGTPGT
ncbi:MAG TPA: ABC transporter substrate-binding protein [Acidimicrobiales bacterium]|nr:ABC transporter substrate-binding protein [Acidimicrobiales bacterium]